MSMMSKAASQSESTDDLLSIVFEDIARQLITLMLAAWRRHLPSSALSAGAVCGSSPKRLVSKMTYYVSSGTLTLHTLTHSRDVKTPRWKSEPSAVTLDDPLVRSVTHCGELSGCRLSLHPVLPSSRRTQSMAYRSTAGRIAFRQLFADSLFCICTHDGA